MKNGILLANFSDEKFWHDLAVRFAHHIGEKFVFFSLAWGNYRDDIYRNLNTRFLINLESLVSFFGKGDCKHPEIILGDYFDDCMRDFNLSTDRVFIKKRTENYIRDYLNVLVKFWATYISCHNIKYVFFESVPHMPWDIVLFYVAKSRESNTLIFRRTIFSDRMLLTTDFRSGEHIDFFSGNHLPRAEMTNLETDNSLILIRSGEINKKSLLAVTHRKLIIITLGIIIKIILFDRKKCPDYFLVGRFYRAYSVLSRQISRVRAQNYYKRLSEPPDYNDNFVYFALHFRPERSTVPEGGIFSDQISAIKLLRDSLPADVKIYVKEHPRQLGDLTPDLRRVHQNEIKLYLEIKKLSGLRLIPVDCPQKELIKKCLITASITGSVVWEGVEQCKPGITFGNTWHSLCKSTPDISKSENLSGELRVLMDKPPSAVMADRNEFLSKLDSIAFLGCNSQYVFQRMKSDPDEILNSMTHIMLSAIKGS